MANCTHPAICNGVCLVCHENIAEKPHTQAVNVIDNPADKPPEKAQETPKKTIRKRKA
jgi:hypothetical protein